MIQTLLITFIISYAYAKEDYYSYKIEATSDWAKAADCCSLATGEAVEIDITSLNGQCSAKDYTRYAEQIQEAQILRFVREADDVQVIPVAGDQASLHSSLASIPAAYAEKWAFVVLSTLYYITPSAETCGSCIGVSDGASAAIPIPMTSAQAVREFAIYPHIIGGIYGSSVSYSSPFDTFGATSLPPLLEMRCAVPGSHYFRGTMSLITPSCDAVMSAYVVSATKDIDEDILKTMGTLMIDAGASTIGDAVAAAGPAVYAPVVHGLQVCESSGKIKAGGKDAKFVQYLMKDFLDEASLCWEAVKINEPLNGQCASVPGGFTLFKEQLPGNVVLAFKEESGKDIVSVQGFTGGIAELQKFISDNGKEDIYFVVHSVGYRNGATCEDAPCIGPLQQQAREGAFRSATAKAVQIEIYQAVDARIREVAYTPFYSEANMPELIKLAGDADLYSGVISVSDALCNTVVSMAVASTTRDIKENIRRAMTEFLMVDGRVEEFDAAAAAYIDEIVMNGVQPCGGSSGVTVVGTGLPVSSAPEVDEVMELQIGKADSDDVTEAFGVVLSGPSREFVEELAQDLMDESPICNCGAMAINQPLNGQCRSVNLDDFREQISDNVVLSLTESGGDTVTVASLRGDTASLEGAILASGRDDVAFVVQSVATRIIGARCEDDPNCISALQTAASAGVFGKASANAVQIEMYRSVDAGMREEEYRPFYERDITPDLIALSKEDSLYGGVVILTDPLCNTIVSLGVFSTKRDIDGDILKTIAEFVKIDSRVDVMAAGVAAVCVDSCGSPSGVIVEGGGPVFVPDVGGTVVLVVSDDDDVDDAASGILSVINRNGKVNGMESVSKNINYSKYTFYTLFALLVLNVIAISYCVGVSSKNKIKNIKNGYVSSKNVHDDV